MSQDESSAIWDLSETQRLIEHPAVRLLRSTNAAFTLTFLHRAFKEHHAVAVPESHLRARLENFLDEARSTRPDAYAQAATEYLAAWCGSEQLLLKKLYSDEAEEPVFELTAAAERAMQWLEDLQARPFVATESRFELIVRQLEEIVLFATPDVQRRVEALQAERAKLQSQIEALSMSQTAQTYTPVQLTERFANALDLARGLASDFRQLEENFKEIARALAEAQANPGATKGQMVGQLLDTHAALKDAPQGQSFYAFWSLLSSPERQQRWRELVRAAYRIEGIDPALRANRLLEKLSSRLLAEGERVVRSNERTAATLRRALESAATGEDRRMRELIRQIQQAALACRVPPATDTVFVELPGPPDVFASFSRPHWQPEAVGRVPETLSIASHDLDWDMVERFRTLAELSLSRVREQVLTCLVASDTVLLSEVLRRFPPSDGILEIVGYLVVALESPHYVAPDQYTDVWLSAGEGGPECWRVPEALFARQAR